MKVIGLCRICERQHEDNWHFLYRSPHANALWSTMRDVWLLPSDSNMFVNNSAWFRAMLISMPRQMLEGFLLVSWRIWFA